MRHHTIVFPCLLACVAAAQPIEQVDQRTESVRYGPVAAIGGDRWVVLGSANVEGGIPVPAQFLRAIHTDGTTAWERPIDHEWDDLRLVVLPDSGFLTGGVVFMCDVIGDLSSTLTRYTSNGDSLWSRNLNAFPITSLADGSTALIAVASQDSVLILDMDGAHLHTWPAPEGPVHAMFWSDDLLFLLAGNGLYATDALGNVVGHISMQSPGTGLRMVDEVILVLREDSLLRFTGDLVQLEGAAIIDTALHFVDGNDGIYIRTLNALYTASAQDDLTLFMTIAPLPGLIPRGGSFRHGTFMTSGNTNISGRSSAVVCSTPQILDS